MIDGRPHPRASLVLTVLLAANRLRTFFSEASDDDALAAKTAVLGATPMEVWSLVLQYLFFFFLYRALRGCRPADFCQCNELKC